MTTLKIWDGTAWQTTSGQGANGQGVPAGGAIGAPLVKNSAGDYDTKWSADANMVRRFATAAARDAAMPSPAVHNLTMLDSRGGVLSYWNGSAWRDIAAANLPTGWATRHYPGYGEVSTDAAGDITLTWPAGIFAGNPLSVLITNATAGTPLHVAINQATLTNSSVQFRVMTAAGGTFGSSVFKFMYDILGTAA
jgi:hypothetical protein